MKKSTWDNHGIPDHYENLIVTIKKRGNQIYFYTTLNGVGRTYEPFADNGIVILVSDHWSIAYKLCFEYLPSMEERGKITRYVRANLLPKDVTYFAHTEPIQQEST